MTLLNINAKTAKSAPGYVIQGLELLPHRMPLQIMRDAPAATFERLERIAARWAAPAGPRAGRARRALVSLGDRLKAFLDDLRSEDTDRSQGAWRALERYSACPASSEACRASCLVFSGFGSMPDVEALRLARSLAMVASLPSFLAALKASILDARDAARAKGERLAVRLNVFSDFRWERIDLGLFIGGVTFYDYTKHRPAARTGRPVYYHLTQSWTDTDTEARLDERLAAGNLAVPFLVGKGGSLPTSWRGLPVVDGDETDARFLDPAGVVVGLAVKGKAGSRPTEGVFGVSV